MKTTRSSSRGNPSNAATEANRRTPTAQPAPLPNDLKELAQLKLARLSGNGKLAARLVKSGVGSVRQMAEAPAQALLKRFKKLTHPDARVLYKTQQSARRVSTYMADKAISAALDQSPNGMWGAGGFPGKLPPGLFPCHCGCCDSIFGLKAYLFDLLDLLARYWELDLADVETLLLRSFNEFKLLGPLPPFIRRKADLDCEALNAPLPQARIAVEVLEAYLAKRSVALPSNIARWNEQFVDGLLRFITPRQVQNAVLIGLARTQLLTVANVQAHPNLPAEFAAALADWKTRLNTLVLNLAGIEEAVSLLSDYAGNFTGFAPNTLRRADQQDSTTDERRLREVTTRFEEGREATMRQWLVDYRGALVAATGTSLDSLEAGLFVSLSSGPGRTTTRLQELVISVQQIMENIRSGEIDSLNRPDIPTSITGKLRQTTTLPLAESVWRRLRDYETWLGYIYGWVYPENVLSPLVRVVAGESFERVLDQLQTNPLTAESVRAIYLNAVTSLKG
jgi:hypothetical protein